jgi:SAM-dependent methyltransferase
MARQAALLPAGARVLDAGAGEGQYRALLAHTRYEAQDFAQYGGSPDAHAPETWRYVALDYVCDIAAIPVPDASFDAVVCTEVLEHVPDVLAVLRELARITAPGGRMLLSAPLGSGMHQEPFHFYGGFSRHFWERVLPQLGFVIDEIVPLRGLLSHVAQEVHRAARCMALQGRLTPEQSWVMQEWLPRLLHEEDDAVPVEQFTVGYLVRATKRAGSAGAAA